MSTDIIHYLIASIGLLIMFAIGIAIIYYAKRISELRGKAIFGVQKKFLRMLNYKLEDWEKDREDLFKYTPRYAAFTTNAGIWIIRMWGIFILLIAFTIFLLLLLNGLGLYGD